MKYTPTEIREGYVSTATHEYNETCHIRRDELTDGSHGYGVDFRLGSVALRFDSCSEGEACDLANELDRASSVDVLDAGE